MKPVPGAAKTFARCLNRAALVWRAAFAPAFPREPLQLHP